MSLIQKGTGMETTTLNMKASLGTNEGIALILKEQEKSPIEIQHGRNVPFSTILDERTAQVVTDEAEIENILEDTVPEVKNSVLAGMSALIPSLHGMAPRLWKDEPISETSDMKSLHLTDKERVAVLSIPDLKNAAISASNLLKTAISETAEIADPVQKDKKSLPLTDKERVAVLSIPDLKNAAISASNLLKTAISETAENTDQAGQTQTKNNIPVVDPSSGNHVTDRVGTEKSHHSAEPGFMNRITEILRQKNDEPTAEHVISDIRRVLVSQHDNRPHEVTPKEGAFIPTVTQKPVTAVNDKDSTIRLSASEHMTQTELPDKAIFMKNTQAGTTGPDHDREKSWNTVPVRQIRIPDRDVFPFRTEMSNIPSMRETRLTPSGGPAEINTQAVIDQIIEAKQRMNSGFGRVRITLDPPNLGTITLEIVTRKERVAVMMTADNASVQQALQSRADDIRIALQRQDLKIETFQVLLQDNTSNQQQANSGATFEQHRGQRARQNNPKEGTPIQPLIQSAGESGMVRGLVSIFV